MEFYGFKAQGYLLIEKIKKLGEWTPKDTGKIFYELDTDKIWIGGTDLLDGVNGWFQIGLTERSVNSYHIDWDNNLTYLGDKISAINIPCFYNNEITNVQTSLEKIENDIISISTGDFLSDECIKRRHIDLRSSERLDASYIPISNKKNYFSVFNVDDALEYCYELINDPLLPQKSKFGKYLGIYVHTINNALEELEKYIDVLKASDIQATYIFSPDVSNVQFVLDALYKYLQEVEELAKQTHNITEIKGIPNNFGSINQILRSNGVDGFCLVDLTASIVSTRYCIDDITVQNALDIICGDLTNLNSSIVEVKSDIIIINEHITEILCEIDAIWDQITLLWVAVCELWNQIEKIWTEINKLWDQINLLWDEVCRLWDEIKKIWTIINILKKQIRKKKIYFTLMKYSTHWEYGTLKNAEDYDNYPPLWLFCDFTNWYNDYKAKYDNEVGDKFIVIPIVQFQTFVIPNAFQCWSYISNQEAGAELDNPRNPVWPIWPPIVGGGSGETQEFIEGGTLGEYPFIAFRGSLGGPTALGLYQYPSCPKPYYQKNNWIFYLDVGTLGFDNNKQVHAYSAGGHADYVVYFFGFGYSDEAIMEINSLFQYSFVNAAGLQVSPGASLGVIRQDSIIN